MRYKDWLNISTEVKVGTAGPILVMEVVSGQTPLFFSSPQEVQGARPAKAACLITLAGQLRHYARELEEEAVQLERVGQGAKEVRFVLLPSPSGKYMDPYPIGTDKELAKALEWMRPRGITEAEVWWGDLDNPTSWSKEGTALQLNGRIGTPFGCRVPLTSEGETQESEANETELVPEVIDDDVPF